MQESENVCLQCQQASTKPANRLVQDSCGHKKCRSCLLNDVDKCKQCLGLVSFVDVVTPTENSCKNTNYHTAVIQCNGKAKINCDKVIEESDENEHKSDNKTNQEENVVEAAQKSDKKLGKRKTIPIPTHVIVKTDPVSYFCTICDKTFLTRTHVRYHQYCASEFKPYKCSDCAKEFITKAQLNVHMFNHSETKPFSCSICQKSFTEKSKLNRHMLIHSSEKKFVCSECAKSFKGKESLRLHILIHRNEKPFACNLCSSKFNNSSNLKKHLVSHTNERTHMCDTCGSRFKLKWALSVHKKSHLKLRPHKCMVCPKSFVNFKDLQRHNLIHAESKGYSCGICNTGFKRKDNLHRHMKNSHPGRLAASSTDRSSSRLRRQLSKAITILREIATSYHLLKLRSLSLYRKL
ncbi:hypothetical protein GWI33_022309 [Rhynchophorus ferrugineus]|uniref:C2H2-type domain-containing protein n=1 Tax=Rhynchophorus ferrugineus TaxID=354439 RepID=A0A834MJ56_RHYFE|nr:hypothetical protein GWI33_022309 [Rhynchophorus ferrugineus]